ncbi:MmyB family transcriptional regulator [Mycobacterium antarcticum]|uniref:MmyB family transcriptional regulator n=1 Tax=Mycolicibacterium sp. TUM20985 TaxID=3023370 RepID=UPI002573E626|nr:hypothetical protein [Mycolicibacterium sp. TUM20985]
MKDFYDDDREAMARSAVAVLWMHAVDNPTEPRLSALFGELSLVSEQFRQCVSPSLPGFLSGRFFGHPAPGR